MLTAIYPVPGPPGPAVSPFQMTMVPVALLGWQDQGGGAEKGP